MYLAFFAVSPSLHLHLASAIVFYRLGCDHDARSTEVVQIKVTFVDDNQRDIPVDAAIKSKVRFLRVHPVIDAIIHMNRQHIGI